MPLPAPKKSSYDFRSSWWHSVHLHLFHVLDIHRLQVEILEEKVINLIKEKEYHEKNVGTIKRKHPPSSQTDAFKFLLKHIYAI